MKSSFGHFNTYFVLKLLMASVAALRDYGSSDDDSENSDDSHLKPINTTDLVDQKLAVSIVAAPDVLPNVRITHILIG